MGKGDIRYRDLKMEERIRYIGISEKGAKERVTEERGDRRMVERYIRIYGKTGNRSGKCLRTEWQKELLRGIGG